MIGRGLHSFAPCPLSITKKSTNFQHARKLSKHHKNAERVLISICTPERRAHLRFCLSPFSAGQVAIPAIKISPSSAVHKLLEAEFRMGEYMYFIL